MLFLHLLLHLHAHPHSCHLVNNMIVHRIKIILVSQYESFSSLFSGKVYDF